VIPLARGVAPFGHPWIKACSRLPRAFRSVPRPSSPPSAKASTRCPSLARPCLICPKAHEGPPHSADTRRTDRRPSPLSTHMPRGSHPRTCTHIHIRRPCRAPARLAPRSRERQQSDQQPGRAQQKRPNPDSQRKDHIRTSPSHPEAPRQTLHSAAHALETPPPGDDRDRTGDPLLAKQVLSQLSYAPLRKQDQHGSRADATLPPGDQRLRGINASDRLRQSVLLRRTGSDGPGRTRTSDPTLIKRVL